MRPAGASMVVVAALAVAGCASSPGYRPPPQRVVFAPTYAPATLVVAGAGQSISSVAAACGGNRYAVDQRRGPRGSVLVVAVNGRPLPPGTIASALAAIAPGARLSSSTSLGCAPGGGGADLALMVVVPGGPAHRIVVRIIPTGTITPLPRR